MNRDQMLSILGTMSDDNLMLAMQATGIQADCGSYRDGWGMGGGGMEGGDGDEPLVSWNNTEVKVPPPNKPKFFDKNQTIEVPKAKPQHLMPDMGGMGDDGGVADFAAAAG